MHLQRCLQVALCVYTRYECADIYIYAYIYTYTHIYLSMYTHTHTTTHTHIHTRIYLQRRIKISLCAYQSRQHCRGRRACRAYTYICIHIYKLPAAPPLNALWRRLTPLMLPPRPSLPHRPYIYTHIYTYIYNYLSIYTYIPTYLCIPAALTPSAPLRTLTPPALPPRPSLPRRPPCPLPPALPPSASASPAGIWHHPPPRALRPALVASQRQSPDYEERKYICKNLHMHDAYIYTNIPSRYLASPAAARSPPRSNRIAASVTRLEINRK